MPSKILDLPKSVVLLFLLVAGLVIYTSSQALARPVVGDPSTRPTVAPLASSTPTPQVPATQQVATGLALQLFSSNITAGIDDQVRFDLWVTNPEKLRARGVEVRFPLPVALDLLNATATKGLVKYNPNTRTVKVRISGLPAGQQVGITILTRVNKMAATQSSIYARGSLHFRTANSTSVIHSFPAIIFVADE